MVERDVEHEHVEWPEAQDPIAEAVSVALGILVSFTPVESERRQAVNALIAAHKRAVAARETAGPTWIN